MIAALVLAAGRSTRAGARNKLLADVGGGPLIARVADRVLASRARPVIVVTGHEAEKVRAALAGRDVAFAHNPDHADGMAGSIRAGIAAVPAEAAGALVCLGDMPETRPADIDALIAAFAPEEGRAICVPEAGGRPGNPVLFARALFPELMALAGDTGAKSVIAAHADRVARVPVEGEGPLTDLDTEAEIRAFRGRET